MNLWAAIPLISFLAFFILFFIVTQQAKRRVDKIFALFLLASGVWSFTSFMLVRDPAASTEYLVFWNVLVIAAIPWALTSYYHFVRVYNNKPGGIGLYLGYALALTVLALGPGGYIVKDAYIIDGYLYHDIGYWDYIIAAVLIPLLALIIRMLARRYRISTDPIDRNRTIYLMAGFCIVLVLGYITPFTPALAGLPTDHLGNLANALIIAYAIYRFQLLDTKLVARRGLTYVLLVGALIGVSWGAILIGFEFLSDAPTPSLILFATVVTLLLIVIARPLRQALEKGIDRLFYGHTYNHRRALLGFSTRMGNILNLKELAQAMLPAMTNALDVTRAALLFRGSTDDDFAIQFIYPEDKEGLNNNLKLSADSPIVDWLDRRGMPLDPTQIDSIAELKGLWQTEKEQVVNSGFGLLHPIKSQGRLIGILALGKKQEDRLYSHGDIELVTSIANQAGIIIENAHLYTQATTRANTDGLTSLYNHRHFHQRLEQEIARATRFGTSFSLIMLDLDLFKAYNDIYGHLAGDQVLKKVGLAIENSVRSIDIAFRYGGEEFTVILPETRLDDAYRVAERIRKTIESKTSFREMPVTASLGIASWPSDGVMKEEIISQADAALYRAKQTGRNRTSLSSEIIKTETSPTDSGLETRPRALSVVYALAATVDAKDHYTYGHSRKVSEYAVALAEALKLPQNKLDVVRTAGLLHDIGKLGIPDSILTKPGALNEEEWGPVKTHPELGVEILKRVVDLAKCLPPVMYHHEHFDGNGYPARLKGVNIPLEARILAIADAYDAITSPRPYHSQLTSPQAIQELKRCAGSQFDPELVGVFCRIVQSVPFEGRETETKPPTRGKHGGQH